MINLNNLLQNLNNANRTQGHSTTENGLDKSAGAESATRSEVNNRADLASISNNNVLAHKIVNQSIYQHLSASFSNSMPGESQLTINNDKLANINIEQATTDSANEGVFDFQAVADTVLGFISNSIAKASERGDSDAALQEMFAGARAGVAMGIEQAKQSLNDVSAMNPTIEEGISKSESLISQGIDDLEQQYFPEEIKQSASTPLAASSPSAFLNEASFSPELFSPSSQAVEATSYQSDMYASKDRASELSITTADGDLVRISFSQIQRYQRSESYNQIDAYGSSRSNDLGQEGSNGFYGQVSEHRTQSQYASEMSFNLSIEGELDDEEREAIESLIAQVNSLQKEFFNGDIETAYQQALAIGFDDSQISEFSLALEQVETYVVQERYSEVARYSDSDAKSGTESLKPLLSYIQQLDQNLEQARQLFEKNDEKIQQLMDQVFTAEFGENTAMLERLNQFNERFIES